MHHDDSNFKVGFASGDYAHPGAGPDLTATDRDLKGFFGGFAPDGYGYVVPFTIARCLAKVAPIRLRHLLVGAAARHAAADGALKGFHGGFASGYGYVVLNINGANFGKVSRSLRPGHLHARAGA